MMRVLLAAFWGLVIFCLLRGEGEAQAATLSAAAPWQTKIKGDSLESYDKAKHMALLNAQEMIGKFLENLQPPLTYWKPSLEFIQSQLLEREGSETSQGNIPIKTWELTLKPADMTWFRKLDSQAYLEQEKRERPVRAQARMYLATKILAGALVFLAAVAGYIRVDEWTRRVYSRWWQLALAGLLVATGTGLWMLP